MAIKKRYHYTNLDNIFIQNISNLFEFAIEEDRRYCHNMVVCYIIYSVKCKISINEKYIDQVSTNMIVVLNYLRTKLNDRHVTLYHKIYTILTHDYANHHLDIMKTEI